MTVPDKMAKHLADLISSINPYANRTESPKTGEMDIYAGNGAPKVPPEGEASQIVMEVVNKYQGDWDFKGQPNRVARSARIRYRCPVLDDKGNVLYYFDEYLLIGFAGANGP
jgi:hypothetical protein